MLPVIDLLRVKDGEMTPITDIVSGPTIVDFWTVACERCPAALLKMDTLAAQIPAVCCVSVCLRYPDLDKVRATLANIGGCENMHSHFAVAADADRLKLKASLDEFPSVPYYCFCTPTEVLAHGPDLERIMSVQRDMDLGY